MRINLAIIISFLVLVIGIVFNQSYLWIPISVLIAGFIDLFTRRWVASDRLGSAQTLSVLLKSVLSLIILYAMVGQVVCVGLFIYWLI
jgi:hypothetical protein